MQFYLKDWLADTRILNLAERGLWIDALAFMFRAPRRGYLIMQNGCKPDAEALRNMFGTQNGEAESVLARILAKGVASSDEQGVIYCRRMAREAQTDERRSELGRAAAEARWNAERMQNDGPPTPTPSPTPVSKGLEHRSRDADSESPPPSKDSSTKAEENIQAVKVRNWFAACYRKANGSDLPGFDPQDRRMSVQDRRACVALHTMYVKTREGKPGYIAPLELRRRLYHALAGNYYKLRAPASIAEFKRILPNCTDSALRPEDQRKAIPHLPAKPKPNETPGAERRFYADADPWAESGIA